MADFLDAETIKASRGFIHDELIGRGIPPLAADAWLAAWEAEAERLRIDRRVTDFWTLGSVWIRERISKRPPEAAA